MIIMEVYKPEDGFVMAVSVFTIFGMWPTAVKLPTLRRFYNIFSYCFHFTYNIALLPTQVINMYVHRKDLYNLIEDSFFTMTCFVFFVKMINIFFKQKKIEELLKRLNNPIFTPTRKEHFLIARKSANYAIFNCVLFYSMCVLTCIWWIIYPLVDDSQVKALLYGAWYPFNVTIEPYYTYVYSFQCCMVLLTANINSMMDMFVIAFFITMLGQLEMLKIDFKKLTDINDKNINGTENRETSSQAEDDNLTTNSSFNEDNNAIRIYEQRIINYVNRYRAILAYIHDVVETFGTSIMVQFCGSSVALCLSCFLLTLLEPNTIKFYVILQYLICMLFQMYIYMRRGNEITMKTSELINAIYQCSWASVPNKGFRQLLCIIMSRLQVPIQIRIWNFVLLSLNTFLGAVKTSYSFYVLLRQFQKKRIM